MKLVPLDNASRTITYSPVSTGLTRFSAVALRSCCTERVLIAATANLRIAKVIRSREDAQQSFDVFVRLAFVQYQELTYRRESLS